MRNSSVINCRAKVAILYCIYYPHWNYLVENGRSSPLTHRIFNSSEMKSQTQRYEGIKSRLSSSGWSVHSGSDGEEEELLQRRDWGLKLRIQNTDVSNTDVSNDGCWKKQPMWTSNVDLLPPQKTKTQLRPSTPNCTLSSDSNKAHETWKQCAVWFRVATVFAWPFWFVWTNTNQNGRSMKRWWSCMC